MDLDALYRLLLWGLVILVIYAIYKLCKRLPERTQSKIKTEAQACKQEVVKGYHALSKEHQKNVEAKAFGKEAAHLLVEEAALQGIRLDTVSANQASLEKQLEKIWRDTIDYAYEDLDDDTRRGILIAVMEEIRNERS